MAATKLDGAGTQKMKTLEEAMMSLQSIHGMVERMGVEVKNSGSVGILPNQIKRSAGTLQGQLKGQFGMIAELVSAFLLSSTRSAGNDQNKVRGLREGVAQIRVQLELAVAKTIELHKAADSH